MVTAEDVYDQDNLLLVAKGVPLTAGHLTILKDRFVFNIEIQEEDDKDAQTEPIDPQTLKSAREHAQWRFQHTDREHELISALIEICTAGTAQKIADQARPPKRRSPETFKSSGKPGKAKKLGKADLERLLGDEIKLPSLPTTFVQLNEIINSPKSSATHVAAVINKSPSLSAILLKIVNSAFYSLPTKVETISRAVTIIGSKQLSDLALGTSVMSIFKDIPPDLIDMQSFWEHSLACGICARIIAGHLRLPDTERYFVAGLLHDVGLLLIYKELPETAREVVKTAIETDGLLYECEKNIMRFDHAEAGGKLLAKWKLPPMLTDSVMHHHGPKGSESLGAEIVHISDIIVNALEMGSSGEHLVPPPDQDAWNAVGLPVKLLVPIVDQVELQVKQTAEILLSGDLRR